MNAFVRITICALATLSLANAPAAAPVAAPAQSQPAAEPSVTRSSFIATMDAEFRAKDLDHDGKISRAEVEQYERYQTLYRAQAQNRALFARLDANRDGQLSPAEFAALVGQPPLPDVQPEMNRFDANRDQMITLIEYRAAKLANFDRLDTDHDGVVTPAEMRAGGLAPTGR